MTYFVPAVGSTVRFYFGGGAILCAGTVLEVTKDDPPCVVVKIIGLPQRVHLRVTELLS